MTICCPACANAFNPSGGGRGPVKSLALWDLYQCKSCGHCCCPDAFKQTVDYDEVYDRIYEDQQLEKLSDPARHSQFILLPPYLQFHRTFGNGNSRNLLDVGCGAGRFLLAARGLGWLAKGTEPAAQAVATGQALGLDISSQDPLSLLPDSSFDVLTLFDVLEHLVDPADFLVKLLPLIKTGGSLFLTVPNWDCPIMQSATRLDWLPPMHLQFFTEGSLRRMLERTTGQHSVVECGSISTDPCPPTWIRKSDVMGQPAGLSCFLEQRLRWLGRRLRKRPVHQAQLYLHARLG
jgi:SAM-dependent methyltransferase